MVLKWLFSQLFTLLMDDNKKSELCLGSNRLLHIPLEYLTLIGLSGQYFGQIIQTV